MLCSRRQELKRDIHQLQDVFCGFQGTWRINLIISNGHTRYTSLCPRKSERKLERNKYIYNIFCTNSKDYRKLPTQIPGHTDAKQNYFSLDHILLIARLEQETTCCQNARTKTIYGFPSYLLSPNCKIQPQRHRQNGPKRIFLLYTQLEYSHKTGAVTSVLLIISGKRYVCILIARNCYLFM